jgi:hypothetical protein
MDSPTTKRAKVERCTVHPVTNPVNDCAACQCREQLAIVLFQKMVWANSGPGAEPRRWDVDDECPEWMRGDYRYQADAALEMLLPDFADAEAAGYARATADAANAARDCAERFRGDSMHGDADTLEAFAMQLDAGRCVGASERGGPDG